MSLRIAKAPAAGRGYRRRLGRKSGSGAQIVFGLADVRKDESFERTDKLVQAVLARFLQAFEQLFVANTPLDRKINGLGGLSLASPFSCRSVLQT